jgi:hypothetical protein
MEKRPAHAATWKNCFKARTERRFYRSNRHRTVADPYVAFSRTSQAIRWRPWRSWLNTGSTRAGFFKTKAEREQETALSRHARYRGTQEKTRPETTYDRLEHKLFYRINFDRFDELMAADSLAKVEKPLSAKSDGFA